MSDNIRVGLIGYGYASKTFHAPLIVGTPGLELAAVSSSDEASEGRLAYGNGCC